MFSDEKDFVEQIKVHLENFGWKRDNVAQCRCFICGDSQKSKRKRRLTFYRGKDEYSDQMMVKCFNCGYSSTLRGLLKSYFPEVYSAYRFKNFSLKPSTPVNTSKLPDQPLRVNPTRTSCEEFCCVPAEQLPVDHYAVKYMSGRGIPRSLFNRFWFSPDFKITVQRLNEDVSNSIVAGDSRLVIPFRFPDGKVYALQGRDLTGKSSRKYMLIKADERQPKLYGLDTIDIHRRFFVVEGAIDSLFIDNCLATNDLNLLRLQHENAVYIPDNQYRHPEVVGLCSKIIAMNKPIVLFPKGTVGKDINEMVQTGININELIQNNIFCGLSAQLQFNQLKGI